IEQPEPGRRGVTDRERRPHGVRGNGCAPVSSEQDDSGSYTRKRHRRHRCRHRSDTLGAAHELGCRYRFVLLEVNMGTQLKTLVAAVGVALAASAGAQTIIYE